MGIYLFIFLGLSIIGLIYPKVREKKLCIFLFFLVVFLISAFRASFIGKDYETYVSVHRSKLYLYGWGYNMLSCLANFLGESYIWLVIFGNLWMTYSKKIDKKYLLFSLGLWVLNPYCFIQSSMNILRQGCAMSCVLFATCFLNKGWKKNLYYLLFILLGGAFHKSAYAFILLLPFGMLNWKRSFHLILLLVCVIINLLFNGRQLIQPFAKLLGYSGYLNYAPSSFDVPVFTLFVVFVVVYLLYRYPILYQNKEEKWYVDIYLVSLSLLLVLVKNDIAYRMYIYFSFISPISISYIIKNTSRYLRGNIEKRLVKIGYIGYYTALYWMFLLMQMLNHNIHYFPFRFWK